MAPRFESTAKLTMIIDFAVEDGPHGSVLIAHRLCPCRRQVQYAQARMDKGSLRPYPCIRSAMVQHLGHRGRMALTRRYHAQPACDPTHTSLLLQTKRLDELNRLGSEVPEILRRFITSVVTNRDVGTPRHLSPGSFENCFFVPGVVEGLQM